MPAGIVAAANRVFNAVIRQPEVKRLVERTQAGRRRRRQPEQFAAFIQAESRAGRR